MPFVGLIRELWSRGKTANWKREPQENTEPQPMAAYLQQKPRELRPGIGT